MLELKDQKSRVLFQQQSQKYQSKLKKQKIVFPSRLLNIFDFSNQRSILKFLISTRKDNILLVLMNTHAHSYKRYWEPSYLQTTGLSLVAGAVSSFITYPLEFLKTVIQHQAVGLGFRGRLVQHQGYNPFLIMRQIHGTGAGLTPLFEGFDAHLFGRLTYLAVRNTLYTIIYNQYKPIKPYNDLSYREKSIIAGIAGAVGAAVSHPFTVLSIRQILDGQVKKEWRRNYSSSLTEALGELKASGEHWNGLKVNIWRHVLFNVSLTGPYDYFKEGFFTRFGEWQFVDPLALSLATFITASVTLPLDNIRTRLVQSFKELDRNRINFTSISEGISRSIHIESHPFALWAGFYTFYPQLFIYAYLTVEITNTFTESWKKKEGLLEWQI